MFIMIARSSQLCPWIILISAILAAGSVRAFAASPQTSPGWELSGRVTDSAGKEMSDVRVQLHKGVSRDANSYSARSDMLSRFKAAATVSAPLGECLTGKDGIYRFAGIEFETVSLSFTTADGRVACTPAFDVSRVKGLQDNSVSIPDAEEWTGKVVGPHGKGLPNYTVRYVILGQNKEPLLGGQGMATTATDGAFRLNLIPFHEYLIFVDHPEDSLARVIEIDRAFRRNKGGELGVLSVSRKTEFSGRLVDVEGKPLSGVTIGGSVFSSLSYFETRTDTDGRFKMPGVHPDTSLSLAIRDSKWCLAPSTKKGDFDPDYRDGMLTVTVPRIGGKAELVQLEAVRTARVQGVVLDSETGSPIPGARVEAMVFNASGRLRCIYTDKKGRYELSDLPPVEVRVMAWHPDYIPHSASSWSPRGENRYGQEPRRALFPGKDHEMPASRMVRAITISGRVLAHDGKPIAGARLFYKAPNQGMEGMMMMFFPGNSAVSDSDGCYRMRGVAPLAKVADIRASAVGTAGGERRVRLKEVARSPESKHLIEDVDIVLRRGVKLQWALRMGDKTPAVGYRVYFTVDREDLPEGPENRARSFSYTTDRQGVLDVTLPYAGRYTINVRPQSPIGRPEKQSKDDQLTLPPEFRKLSFKDGAESKKTVTLIPKKKVE